MVDYSPLYINPQGGLCIDTGLFSFRIYGIIENTVDNRLLYLCN